MNDSPDFKASRRQKAPRAIDLSKIDRLPPHSMEAEQGVLGCCLLAPNESLPLFLEKLTPDVFYDLRHQQMIELLVEMFEKKEPVDLITVQQQLKDKNQLEAVGGIAYLTSLQDAVPSAANLGYYMEIIREKYLLRRMIQTCTSVVGEVYTSEGEVEALLDKCESEVLAIRQVRKQETGLSIKETVAVVINEIEQSHATQGRIEGLSTGFVDLDKKIHGLTDGEMIIIAARPSMGKTALAMNIVEHVAINLKQPVGVFELEMKRTALVKRMIASRARVSLSNIRDGIIADRDFAPLTNAAGAISHAPLYIDDTRGLSILQLRARARRMWQQYGIKLLVIDYLQLLHSTSKKADNRQQEIADISCGVKTLAGDLNIPVIVLAQLNRDIEKDKKRRPRLSDLRESGALEQDGDTIILLSRKPGENDEEPVESDNVLVLTDVAKQRNGETGAIDLNFMKSYTRFESAARYAPEDYLHQ